MRYYQFEELPVWKEAADLARLVLDIFQPHAGLRNQLERAVFYISNNIAEGFERGTTNELLAFLYIARGSAGEVRSMLHVLNAWNAFSDTNLKLQISQH